MLVKPAASQYLGQFPHQTFPFGFRSGTDYAENRQAGTGIDVVPAIGFILLALTLPTPTAMFDQKINHLGLVLIFILCLFLMSLSQIENPHR